MGRTKIHPELVIPDDAWDDTGSKEHPKSRLLATVAVNNCYFHAEAIQVIEDENFCQVAADEEFREYFDNLYGACGPDGPMETVEIGGLNYVIFIYPFC